MFGPEIIRINQLIKTARSAVSNFENVTLVVRRRVHFQVFLVYFWLLHSLQKEVF